MTYSEPFENFWQRYGADESMSVTSKGSKLKAYESWEKVGKKWASREHKDYDEVEFAQQVWRGYEAQKANRRALRSTKTFVPQLPMVTTWLNQHRYDQEIDQPTGELRRQAQSSNAHKCDSPDCGEPVVGRSETGGWICKSHVIRAWGDANRESFRLRLQANPRQSGESWREWSWRTMMQTDIGKSVLAKMKARNPELRILHDEHEEKLRAAHRARLEEHLRNIRAEAAKAKAQVETPAGA